MRIDDGMNAPTEGIVVEITAVVLEEFCDVRPLPLLDGGQRIDDVEGWIHNPPPPSLLSSPPNHNKNRYFCRDFGIFVVYITPSWTAVVVALIRSRCVPTFFCP